MIVDSYKIIRYLPLTGRYAYDYRTRRVTSYFLTQKKSND